MKRTTIDWLRVERSIRDSLILLRSGERNAVETLVSIDQLLAAETRRGSVLSPNCLAYVGQHIDGETFDRLRDEAWKSLET